MTHRATRPSRVTNTQDWRRQERDKKAREAKLAEHRLRAEQGKPLADEGE